MKNYLEVNVDPNIFIQAVNLNFNGYLTFENANIENNKTIWVNFKSNKMNIIRKCRFFKNNDYVKCVFLDKIKYTANKYKDFDTVILMNNKKTNIQKKQNYYISNIDKDIAIFDQQIKQSLLWKTI